MTKEEIQELARKVLVDHNLFAVPVNPVEVASRLGLRTVHAVFSEPKYSGLTARRKNGITTILVKEGEAPVRKRFTVAHEIGHALLHLQDGEGEIIDTDVDLLRSTESQVGAWTDVRRREYEANVFAAELLMPRELVTSMWARIPAKDHTVSVMAEIFQVSEAAMGYRLDDLGVAA